MVNLKTTGRKDDLESLMYLICFLMNGTLPIIDYINQNIEGLDMESFFDKVLEYRREKQLLCHTQIISMLPGTMRTAFQYISSLSHDSKPDYNLIKFYFTFDREDEILMIESKLTIPDKRLALDMFYDSHPKANYGELRMPPKQKDALGRDIIDTDLEFNFAEGIEENIKKGWSVEQNFKKIDTEAMQRMQVRDFILNHKNLAEVREQIVVRDGRGAVLNQNAKGGNYLQGLFRRYAEKRQQINRIGIPPNQVRSRDRLQFN